MFFFFNDTATTEIYTTANTLSLHDALPINRADRIDDGGGAVGHRCRALDPPQHAPGGVEHGRLDTSAADVDCHYARLWVIHPEPPGKCELRSAILTGPPG